MLTFHLSDDFISQYTRRSVPWGFGCGAGNSLGEITWLTKYSRVKPDGTKEHWHEGCRRVIEGMFSILKDHCERQRTPWNHMKAQRTAEDAYDRLFTMKWTPPGRGLWMMGTPFVHEEGSASLQNCAFISTETLGPRNPTLPFTRLMEMSMLGIGVGFDTLGANKLTVHEPIADKRHVVIDDSREGWCDSVDALLRSYLLPKQEAISFDYTRIRAAGEPIRRFGGVAAGPAPLKRLHAELRQLLDDRGGQEFTSVDIVDVMNLVGKCVVAGNVRRSAELALGLPDDKEFLNLKNPDVYPKRMGANGWGFMSNNSVSTRVGGNYDHLIDLIALNGEPGLIYLDLARTRGRLADPPNDRDYRVKGVNPCLTGDTLIAVADGRNAVPIKQLAEEGKEYPVYTTDDTGKVTISTASRTWLTQRQAEVFELTLDDGTAVKATGNHRFMLRNGSYRELSQLQPGDRLMPFNTYVSNKAYRQVASNTGRDRRQYRMIVDHFKLLDGLDAKTTAVHHRNFDHFDDSLENLELLPHEAHRKLHSERMRGDKNPMRRPDVAARVSATLRIRMKGEGNSHYGKKHSDAAKKIIGVKSRANWARQRERMVAAVTSYWTEETRKEHSSRMTAKRVPVCCRSCSKHARVYSSRVSDGSWTCTPCVKRQNHKVVSVRHVGTEDVYDITVPGTHNFGIITSAEDSRYVTSSGVFVHNCAEQSLEHNELCTLVETYPVRHENLDDYKRTLKVAYLYGKAVTLLPTHWPESNEVMQRNRRIGTSVSGVAQFIELHGWTELRAWLDEGYAEIHRRDVQYSEWLGVRESVKTTTVKPSGTVSLLPGVTPGVHWPENTVYIRRMRFRANDPIVQAFIAAGYKTEPDVMDEENTVVVEFPTLGPNVRSSREVSVWEKVSVAAALQKHWSDNAVSATFTFRDDERDQIGPLLHAFDGQLKSVSFLPLREAGAYAQMPYEPITVEDYEKMTADLKRIDFRSVYKHGTDAEGERYCTTDVCEVRI